VKKCTAFVLGGGGSHGALQVGALRAFIEVGIAPQLLVGTSIGAVNAAGLAIWGYSPEGLQRLEQGWSKVADAQLLDERISQLILRAILHRPSNHARRKAEDFFISLGLSRDLKFGMINGIKLAMVSADIESGQPIIYGQNPNELILDSLLTSIAIPPWFAPSSREGRILMDGGALSNVPIEPAVRLGATEIVAFDLNDCAHKHDGNISIPGYFQKYFQAISQRTLELEIAYAELQGVPVHRVTFTGMASCSIHDFSCQRALIETGYAHAQEQLAKWNNKLPAVRRKRKVFSSAIR
jgi:NTE family protein